jgi:preprotein translocase subunit YajC
VNGFGFLLIIVALAFIWIALVRPQRRRQQAQAQMWEGLAEGDEVVTAGGIYGEVTGFQGDDIVVRIAPELDVRVARRAIAGVITRAELEEDAAADAERPAAASTGDAESYSEKPR